ncbi:hypothetical protein OIV83_005348 [Microbotryomycetes sp. JL201]|nr:hypothetical protein OIV83_005348 [Microbotryomycetes sp. JL201]
MTSNVPLNVFVFGAGAVGSVHAYIFQKAGARVTIAARSNAKVAKEHGLDFQSEKYGNSVVKFDQVVESPADDILKGQTFDFVVMCNKAIQMTPSASEQIAPIVSRQTTIVIIQNGVGNADQFRERFPDNVIISAVTWVNAAQPKTGTIVHKSNEKMEIGVEWSNDLDKQTQQDRLNVFVGMLDKAGSEYLAVDNIQQWRWKDFLSSSPAAESTARALCQEMALIARTLGHEVDDDYLESLLTRPDLRQGGIISSMYTDAMNQRPMEVEVILQAPLRYAKQLGLQTPVLETCVAIMTALDIKFQKHQQQKP